MNREDAEEYTRIAVQFGDGWISQVALGVKMGVPKTLGISRKEWADKIGVSIRDVAERRAAVAELNGEGLSARAIADVLGVDPKTVRKDMRENPPADNPQQRDSQQEPPAEVRENPPADNEVVEAELVEDDDLSTELAIPDDDDMPENVPDPRRTDHPDKISRLNILSVFAGVNDRLQIILKQQEPPSGVTVDIDIFFSIVDQLEERGWRGN